MVSQRETPVSTNPANIFGEGIAAALKGLQQTEPSDDPQFEPDDPETEAPEAETPEAEEPEAPEAEPETPAPEAKAPKRSIEDYADLIVQDGWQRLSEVPPRQHQEVVAIAAQRIEAQAREQERNAIAAQLEQERNLTRFIADVDQHFATDPDGKLAWLQSGDPQARIYIDGKTYLTGVQNQTPQQRVDSISALQQRSARQYGRLDGFTDLQREIANRQQQGRYPATEEGLTQLERDVDQLLVDAANGKGRARGTTPQQRTARRPVLTGESRPSAGRPNTGPDISKIKDPNELFTLGVTQQMQRRAATNAR